MNLVDRFSTLFSGQQLKLNTVPPSLLPKGLQFLQAERLAGMPQDESDLPVVTHANIENRSANADVMNPFANPTPDQALDNHNEVEHIIMLAQGSMPTLPVGGVSLKDRLADIERDLISQALARTDGNVSQTARLLSLQRTTLIEKIHKYDLRPASTGSESPLSA